MDEREFIRVNGPSWKKLEEEVKFFSKRSHRINSLLSRKPLTKERVDDFIVLYNKTANNLAYCRTYYGNTDTERYLNKLLSMAHIQIYMRKNYVLRSILSFFAKGFSTAVRKEIIFVIVSFLLMFIPFLVSYIYTCADIENSYAFIEPGMVNSIRREGNYDPHISGMSLLQSVLIGTNNINVCIYAFAGGATLGLFTIYVLITNGLSIGALAGLYYHIGQSKFFWSLILPHGVTELFCIFISGASGLIVAYSIINPGKLKRKDSIIIRTLQACKLMGGCIILLIISAIIEGYFTPLDLPYELKYGFSLMMLILLTLYISLPGRKSRKLELQ